MDLLIPIGQHLFSADALKKAAAEAIAAHPDKSNILKGTVDSEGAKVVLVIGAKGGAVKLQTAYEHDWQGKNTFGIGGSYAW